MPGSAALALGYLLHVDPWGGLHWDTHDFFLGLQCSLPILALCERPSCPLAVLQLSGEAGHVTGWASAACAATWAPVFCPTGVPAGPQAAHVPS